MSIWLSSCFPKEGGLIQPVPQAQFLAWPVPSPEPCPAIVWKHVSLQEPKQCQAPAVQCNRKDRGMLAHALALLPFLVQM